MLTVFNYYLDSEVCHNWLPMSYMYVNLLICRDLILLPVEFCKGWGSGICGVTQPVSFQSCLGCKAKEQISGNLLARYSGKQRFNLIYNNNKTFNK